MSLYSIPTFQAFKMTVVKTIRFFLLLLLCHCKIWFWENDTNYRYPVNPLVPSAHENVRIAKISILKLEGTIKKISYERRDYESVDEKSLS